MAVATASATAFLADTGGAAATPQWRGSASCTIAVSGTGYQHTERQRWQLGGPTTTRGAFRFVRAQWTDAGGGSSHVTQGDQTRDITWTVKAAAAGRFQFVVRASDGKLLIGQANAQLRVPDAITGTQQLTVGGVPQTPGDIGLEAFETHLPRIVVSPKSRSVSGSTSGVVKGSFGPFQPGDATVTKSCSWRFSRSA